MKLLSEDWVSAAAGIALLVAALLALGLLLLVAKQLVTAPVNYMDADGQQGHELLATEVHELRRDVWVIQTAIAPPR